MRTATLINVFKYTVLVAVMAATAKAMQTQALWLSLPTLGIVGFVMASFLFED